MAVGIDRRFCCMKKDRCLLNAVFSLTVCLCIMRKFIMRTQPDDCLRGVLKSLNNSSGANRHQYIHDVLACRGPGLVADSLTVSKSSPAASASFLAFSGGSLGSSFGHIFASSFFPKASWAVRGSRRGH